MRAYAVLCIVLTLAVFLCPIAALGAQKDENEQSFNLYESKDENSHGEDDYISVMSSSGGETEEIKLREYVIGAVAAEMSPLYHTQALKAQAVACYTYAKRQSLYTMVPFEDVDTYLTIEESQLPESVALRHIKLEHLRNMWAKLPVEDRLLLEQKYVLDWSDAELAASLGIKPQSVRMRLTRAKRNAIHHLKEQGFQISEWL